MASFDTGKMEGKEEDFAVGRSSKSDAKFDTVIGFIEDTIMEEEFQRIQEDFMEKYYLEFEDTEENKLCYTDIHKAYTELIERYLSQELLQRMASFSMSEFQTQLISRKNELEGEVFEMLLTFSDFMAFKEMMLDYRADKEGRTVDLSGGFTVTSLGGATSNGISHGLGVGGVSGAEAPGCRVNVMDSQEPSLEGESSPRLDCGEPMVEDSTTPRIESSSDHKTDAENTDAYMESPR